MLHIELHCNTLQQIATRCNTLQHTTYDIRTLDVAPLYLQPTCIIKKKDILCALRERIIKRMWNIGVFDLRKKEVYWIRKYRNVRFAKESGNIQVFALNTVCYMQCVAVCCSVLQSVAICCSVLQCNSMCR